MTTGEDDSTPPLRSDAERNRERVVAAARVVFGREGVGASMASVAREAEVGIATLFRRFPVKEDLVAAVFADRMDAYAEAVNAALADPDPWLGFIGFLDEVCAMQAADRGFADVMTMTFPTAKPLEARRQQAYTGVVELIGRAKAAGQLREDFQAGDVVLVLMANVGLVTATRGDAPDAWRRFLAYLIQSFQAPARDELPQAPSDKALYRSMVNLGTTRSALK